MTGYASTKYSETTRTATILPWSDSSVPTGFLECNGADVSRTTYADLFAVIGTTYGSGDGSTTFGLPNLQDNVAVGKSNTKALASTGGSNTVTGNISNRSLSSAQLASHSHNYLISRQAAGSGYFGDYFLTLDPTNAATSNTGSGSAHDHNFTGAADSALQPYLTLIYIIKT